VSREPARLPRFHDDQQVASLKFEICSIAGAMPDQLEIPTGGNPARGRVGGCAGIDRKSERGSRQTVTRGTPLGVRTAADIAVAYEHDPRHPSLADLLEPTIPPGQVLEPCQHQAYEPAIGAKA